MGCTFSSHLPQTTNSINHESNPLSATEIEQRIDASTESKILNVAGVTMRYAFVSQRGYYPNALDKDNQDQYIVLPSYGRINSHEQAYFGIFDGHGKDGHHCARYARDHLAKCFIDILERNSSTTSLPKSAIVKDALVQAHLHTNEMMHSDRRFDDSLSGTTSITLFLRGRTMFISNVGDSRAIVITRNKEGRLVAKPLSNDQTPYRKDERERIKKTGARILSMDQIEGLEPVHENWGDLNLGEDIDEGGDPPRVWSPKGDYPGTAFTRSLGDRFAEDCGVFAEPEILERDISPNDKYLVIASDGVFEFLTNQMVADEMARHTDPLSACKAVVSTAYHMWLQYEVRTDDITIIVIYLDDVGGAAAIAGGTSTSAGASGISSSSATAATTPTTALTLNKSSFSMTPDKISTPTPNSPKISRGNSSSSPSTLGMNPSSQDDGDTNASNGTIRARKMDSQASIDENIEQRPVRRTMSREKRKQMIQLGRDTYADDDDVCIEGNSSGSGSNSMERELSEEEMHALFIPKSEADQLKIGNAIKSNFLFQHLNATQRSAVIGVMKEVNVKAGDRIIRQGEKGDKFYVVDTGKFEVRVRQSTALASSAATTGDSAVAVSSSPMDNSSQTMSNNSSHGGNIMNGTNSSSSHGIGRVTRAFSNANTATTTINNNNANVISVDRVEVSNDSIVVEHIPSTGMIEYEPHKELLGNVVHVYESGENTNPGFGELSLMYGKPRAASVIALTDGKLWALDRKIFQRVVLRPKSYFRRGIIRTLKSIELFKCLNITQMQRLTDLLREASYVAGDVIAVQGQMSTTMYMIASGQCEATHVGNHVNNKSASDDGTVGPSVSASSSSTGSGTDDAAVSSESNSARLIEESNNNSSSSSMENAAIDASSSTTSTTSVRELKVNAYFDEQCLLDRGAACSATVVVTSEVAKVLYIDKSEFEEVLGPLATIQASFRARRQALAGKKVPASINDITLHGVISDELQGHLLLGTFGFNATSSSNNESNSSSNSDTNGDTVEKHPLPNVSIRTFLLSEVERMSLRGPVIRYIDACKAMRVMSNPAHHCALNPRPLTVLTDPNALHVIFDAPVVAVLGDLVRAHSHQIIGNTHIITYLLACLVSALEAMHSNNIIYRAVQPESLHVDALGQVVLLDYRVCKIGLLGSARTFTICGASDYLAPEQVAQLGHSYPVDLWGLGVLLYEVSIGTHPFSSNSEVATYSRISSFGSKSFSKLDFPDTIPIETKSLINQLLMPTPEARIGAGTNGFTALKKHPFFKAYSECNAWIGINAGTHVSPLLALAQDEQSALLSEGVDKSVLSSFVKRYKGQSHSTDWIDFSEF